LHIRVGVVFARNNEDSLKLLDRLDRAEFVTR
jgi:hypothetical protein